MIELSARELSESVDAFKALLEIKLNGRLAYLLARIMREVEKEYGVLQDTRSTLIRKYCVKDENGTPFVDEQGNNTIEKEYINDFNEEWSAVLHTNITLNIDPIPLKNIENFDFTTEQMLRLMPFIEE